MLLLIIRHATAVPRGTPEVTDDERPLTPRGEKRFRRAARGLRRLLDRPDVILTSPLPRARRTAEIAAEAWRKLEPVEVPALAGGSFEDLDAALRPYQGDGTVVIVGHEPELSEVLGRLLGCAESAGLTFRKGGAALVEVPGTLAGGGRLAWYLPPSVLRKLR